MTGRRLLTGITNARFSPFIDTQISSDPVSVLPHSDARLLTPAARRAGASVLSGCSLRRMAGA